jgi:hypothetical protein
MTTLASFFSFRVPFAESRILSGSAGNDDGSVALMPAKPQPDDLLGTLWRESMKRLIITSTVLVSICLIMSVIRGFANLIPLPGPRVITNKGNSPLPQLRWKLTRVFV